MMHVVEDIHDRRGCVSLRAGAVDTAVSITAESVVRFGLEKVVGAVGVVGLWAMVRGGPFVVTVTVHV